MLKGYSAQGLRARVAFASSLCPLELLGSGLRSSVFLLQIQIVT